MIAMKHSGTKISGIACAVPESFAYTRDLIDDQNCSQVEKFISMTGVERRCVSRVEQTASDLCYIAAHALLEKLQIDKNDIDALIFVTQTPDYRLPSTAHVLHKRLELRKDCFAVDINLGCSGYVYGLFMSTSLFFSSSIKRVLLLTGDTISKIVSPSDRSTSMLFGDAGAATLIERDDAFDISYSLRSNGASYEAIIVPAGAYRNLNSSDEMIQVDEGSFRSNYHLAMNGGDVFQFTISDVPATILEHLASSGDSVSSIDAFYFHQANKFMLKHIAKKIRADIEKVPFTIGEYGNTSVASIPLTIVESAGMELKKDHILLAGFGVGLSWGVATTSISDTVLLPTIFSNEYYQEG